MPAYFELFDDMHIPGRWHVGEICASDGSEPRLRCGLPSELLDLTAEVTNPGRPLDFFLTSFAVPIARAQLAAALATIAASDVQRLPTRIDDTPGFEVLNSVRVVRCLDEGASEFLKWTAQDHRSDLAGKYRQVTRLRLDAASIPSDAHFFRVQGWLVALIVSEAVKRAMETAGCLGATFEPVCG